LKFYIDTSIFLIQDIEPNYLTFSILRFVPSISRFISATILMENMLKTDEEQVEQNAYKYN